MRDSILPRGLADPWLVTVDGEIAGYAGVWNAHFPGRLTEFFVRPEYRERDRERPLELEMQLTRALADASGATELEVQTNILDSRTLIERCTSRVWVENLLFEDGMETTLHVAGATFRRRAPADSASEGDWVVEVDGRVLGAGGWLTHYNPPYADLYMEVVEDARGRGIGAYLVQELRRASAADGLRAAARCDPANEASRRTLERGGMVRCGEILAGTLEVS